MIGFVSSHHELLDSEQDGMTMMTSALSFGLDYSITFLLLLSFIMIKI